MPTTQLHGFTVTYYTGPEFHSLKEEIFTRHCYYFETENPEPYIIDGGAHIGLTTLYFKKNYPGAHIVAIEPHPDNVKVLEQNVWDNHLENVEIVPVALATEESDSLELFSDADQEWLSTTSVHPGAWTGNQHTSPLTVPARPLSSFLNRPIDLLKLDVEGAEQKMLREAADGLAWVKQLRVEFHSRADQNLAQLVEFLEQHGFEITLIVDQTEIDLKKYKGKGLVMIEGSRNSG